MYAYPSQDDILRRYDEVLHPDIFNYFCLHGYQVVCGRSRRDYFVRCLGYSPRRLKVVKVERLCTGDVRNYVYFGSDFHDCMRSFRLASADLLSSELSFYKEWNPLVDDFLEVYQ